jgi:AraC-like DNA-binding protein
MLLRSLREQPILRPPVTLHAFHAPLVANYFAVLKLSAYVWTSEGEWYELENPGRSGDPGAIETHFRGLAPRSEYNGRMARRAAREGVPVAGERGGFWDLFAPIVTDDGTVLGTIVSGPFARAEPEAGAIRRAYRRLSGRQHGPNDPIYSAFLRGAVQTPLLSGRQFDEFSSDVHKIARLLGGQGDPQRIHRELRIAWTRREREHDPYLMFVSASRMVDRLEYPLIVATIAEGPLQVLGIRRRPTDVMAMVPVNRPFGPDPTEWLLAAAAFQKAATALARSFDDTLAGQLGDDGLILLTRTPPSSSEAQRQSALQRIAAAFRRLAQKHGVELRAGVSSRPARGGDPPDLYAEALEAVGIAVLTREPLAFHGSGETASRALHRVARRLVQACRSADSAELSAALEQGTREVFARSAGSTESARAHFESLARELAGALERTAFLEQRTADTILERLEQELGVRQRVHDLAEAFTGATRALMEAGIKPGQSDRDTRIDEARSLIDADPTADLTLGRLARRAGLSQSHFSTLFARRHGVPFKAYLVRARLAKACALLESTVLPIQRVAAASGFGTYAHFARAFQSRYGKSPGAYRAASGA